MRSYETGLLIISNYTHHRHEKIIIHHIIYIKKVIHINFKIHCGMWTARVLQQYSTLIQGWVGITFHTSFVERMLNHNQDHFGVQYV